MNLLECVAFAWRLLRYRVVRLRSDGVKSRMLPSVLIYGGCVGFPDWTLAWVNPDLDPRPGDLVFLKPTRPEYQKLVKFLDVDADGRWLLRTVDVVLKYNPSLHVLAGVVTKVLVPPAGMPAPSATHAAIAREAEEARAELRESCQAILQQRAWGIAHDFSDGTCYEPVAMA